MIEELIARFQDRLNTVGATGVSHMFDLPAFTISNHDTILLNDRETLASGVNAALAEFAGQSLTNVRLVVENIQCVAQTLFMVQITKSVHSNDGTIDVDPWTEHWIVRSGAEGPKLTGMLNFFGSRVDVSAFATPKTVELRAKSIDEFINGYCKGIETADLGLIGQSLEFPAIAVLSDHTRITPDLETYMQFAEYLRNKSREAGLVITHTEPKSPTAVGADLILAPVVLHIRHTLEDRSCQIVQTLVLYIGDEGISCVAVINALDGTLARLAQAEVR